MVCLVSFSSSVDLLSVPPKASTVNVDVTKLVGIEELINSTGIRDLITTNSTSLVQQMAKAHPKQVKGIIALLKGLISSVNGERKIFEDNVRNTNNIIHKVLIHLTALLYSNNAYYPDDSYYQQGVSWYSDGLTKTYADVKKSCESKGKRLCYYKEICPKKGVLIRKKFSHENWSPIVISHNDHTPNWVQVGSSHKLCELITNYHPVQGNVWMNRRRAELARKNYPCCT